VLITFGKSLVHGVNDVKQIEMHKVEPLVLEPRSLEDGVAIEKLKRYT
jgi:hypothetical protein